ARSRRDHRRGGDPPAPRRASARPGGVRVLPEPGRTRVGGLPVPARRLGPREPRGGSGRVARTGPRGREAAGWPRRPPPRLGAGDQAGLAPVDLNHHSDRTRSGVTSTITYPWSSKSANFTHGTASTHARSIGTLPVRGSHPILSSTFCEVRLVVTNSTATASSSRRPPRSSI